MDEDELEFDDDLTEEGKVPGDRRFLSGAHHAVNLSDLIRYHGLHPVLLLLQPLLDADPEHVVMCERGRPDSMAVRIRRDLPAERWPAAYQIIRQIKRIPVFKLRIYQSRTGNGGWKRV